jgi:hypothetical protein
MWVVVISYANEYLGAPDSSRVKKNISPEYVIANCPILSSDGSLGKLADVSALANIENPLPGIPVGPIAPVGPV